jgi:hypothetical protein
MDDKHGAAKPPKSTEEKNLLLVLFQISRVLGQMSSSLSTIANVAARARHTEVSGDETPGAENRVVMSIGGRHYEMIQRWSSREITLERAEDIKAAGKAGKCDQQSPSPPDTDRRS